MSVMDLMKMGSADSGSALWQQWNEHMALQHKIADLLAQQLGEEAAAILEISVSDMEINGGQVVDFPVAGSTRQLVTRSAFGAANGLSNAPAGTTPMLVLPANNRRMGMTIINTGTNAVTLGLCTPDKATWLGGIYLAGAGGSWDGRLGNLMWCGSVSALTNSGTSPLAVVEV